MAKQLQPTDHKNTTYNRPQVPWEFGHLCEGKSCALGASASGKCCGTAECMPIRNGSRWDCTRDAVFGGSCESGPLSDGSCCNALTPCAPQRSIRQQRKVAVWLACGFTIGLLSLLFSAKWLGGVERTIDPGPLTKVHGGGGMTCTDCHQESLYSTSVDIHANMDFGSKKCLECHNNVIGSWENARFAHGLAPDTLNRLKDSKTDDTPSLLVRLASSTPVKDAGAKGELQCATCHREHHGREFDLTALSDQQCQVCHTEQFDSFQDGHPPITSFQSGRRTRIAFDHASHLQTHFGAKKKEWSALSKGNDSCRVCHSPDPSGLDMLAPDFESACATCHDGSTRAGALEVLALPALSPKEVGGWPTIIANPPKLSPLAQWLIAGQSGAADLTGKFQAIEDPRRVTDAAEISTTREMKASLIRVLGKIQKEGPTGYFNTQSLPSGFPAETADHANTVLASIPPAVFQGLLAEIHDAEQKSRVATTPKPDSAPSETTATAAAPAGSLLGTPPPAAAPPGNLLGTPPPAAAPPGNLLGTPPPAAAPPGNLLGTPPPAAAPPGNLLGKAPEASGSPDAPATQSAPTPETGISPTIDKTALARWEPGTTWTYSKLRIAYRPRGHADPILKSWIDAAALTASHPDASAHVKTAAESMLNTAEAGSCLMCHTVDRFPDSGTITVNWHSQLNDSSLPSLTAFNHSKHINSLKVTGLAHTQVSPDFSQSCMTCHQMLSEDENKAHASQFAWNRGLKAPVASDPHAGISNFTPLSLKGTCATCHTEEKAGASCLTCHKYHAEPPIGLPAKQTTPSEKAVREGESLK